MAIRGAVRRTTYALGSASSHTEDEKNVSQLIPLQLAGHSIRGEETRTSQILSHDPIRSGPTITLARLTEIPTGAIGRSGLKGWQERKL